MAPLLSLPNELLIHIFTSAPSIHTAVHFSSANRQLHNIWLEHNDHIVTQILRDKIPAYDDALELAMLEFKYQFEIAESGHESEPRRPVNIALVGSRSECRSASVPQIQYSYLPTLLHNADLAAEACQYWHREYPNVGSPRHCSPVIFRNMERSYYIIRKLVLAYYYREPLDGLNSMLDAEPEVDLNAHYEFIIFLCTYMAYAEEGERQGMDKHEEDMTWEDELADYAAFPWEFAWEVIGYAWMRRSRG